MHTSQVLAALALAAPLVSGSPVDLQPRKQSFRVNQVSSGKKFTKNGPAAYARALGKYHAPVPSPVQEAAASQSGSAAANPVGDDLEYVTPVTIGSQTLNLDFDTGSSDLWVFSDEQSRSQTSGHTTYSTAGKTAERGETWRISYGDGSGAGGNVYADKVVVGGVTATSQAVEAATSVSRGSFDGSDGLLGLADSSINTVSPNKQTTFFDTVSSTLDEPLFTATLKAGAPGSYDFGYIDDSKYSGSISYVPVDFSQGFWQFDTDGYSVGRQSGNFGSAIADTGTTLLLAPSDAVEAYYSQVSSAENSRTQGGYVVDCNADLPDFTITIGGQDATVPGNLINYQAVGDGTCFGGIQENQGLPFSILGDIFLKSMFVVFDKGGTRLGLAPQA